MGKRKKHLVSKPKNTSKQNKRILTIFVCIFVGIAIIFGATLAIISAVKDARSLAYFDGIGIDKGVASYLASYYKSKYMSYLSRGGIEVSDTYAFWNSTADVGKTYYDYLKIETESFIKQLISANKIFDEYTSLSSDDKLLIDKAIEETLAYRANGSQDSFNSLAAEYGFDYSDFKEATRMLYKGWAAKTKIFGEDGSGISSFPEFCEEYYEGYSHAYLLFVRTENVFVLDEAGNRIDDGYGNDKTRPLTAEEKQERLSRIEKLEAAINGINAGTVAPEMYFELLSKYDEGDPELRDGGYYFNSSASYTKEFASQFADIVNKAYELKVGEGAAVSCSIGMCFILKAENAPDAYTDLKSDGFFSDFYSLGADAMYQKLIEEYVSLVELRDKWAEIDLIDIPYNSELVAVF